MTSIVVFGGTTSVVFGRAPSVVDDRKNGLNYRIRQDVLAVVKLNNNNNKDDVHLGQEVIPAVKYNETNNIDGKVEEKDGEPRTNCQEELSVFVNNNKNRSEDDNDNGKVIDNADGNKTTQIDDSSSDTVLQEVPAVVANASNNDKDDGNGKVNDVGLRETNGSGTDLQQVLTVDVNINDKDDDNDNANDKVNDNDDGIRGSCGSDLQEALPVVVSNNINDNGKEDGHVRNGDNENGLRIRKRDKDNAQESMSVVIIINKNNNSISKHIDNVDDNGNDQKIPSEQVSAEQDVECAFSWAVLVGLIMTSIIGGGQVQCINIYFLIFLKEFKRSTSFTAWISAAQTTALCVAGPLTSYLLPKLGARKSICISGILMATCLLLVHFATSVPYLIVIYACFGASQCLLTGGSLAAIAMYFRRRASFATGMFLAGAGMGTMVTGLELEWAVEEFGWRGAMFIQSGIVLHICICGGLVMKRNLPNKTETKLSKADGPADDHALRDSDGPPKASAASRTSLKSLSLDPFFWLSVLSFVSLQASYSTMVTIFKGFVVSAGLESSFTTVLTTAAIGNTVGRVFSGPLSNLICAPIYMSIAALACATANGFYLLANVPWVLAVVGGFYGFFQGQLLVSWLLCVSWVYGHDKMPVVRGNVMFFGVISSFMFPPVAGYTVDITGGYSTALVMVSAANVCLGFCGCITYLIHYRKSKTIPDIIDSQQKSHNCTHL